MTSPRSRRLVLKALLAAPAAAVGFAGGRTARADDAQCVIDDEDGLPQSLGFVAPAPDPAHSCRTCTFWTPAEGALCGRCAMMLRSTPPNGVCDSWASH